MPNIHVCQIPVSTSLVTNLAEVRRSMERAAPGGMVVFPEYTLVGPDMLLSPEAPTWSDVLNAVQVVYGIARSRCQFVIVPTIVPSGRGTYNAAIVIDGATGSCYRRDKILLTDQECALIEPGRGLMLVPYGEMLVGVLLCSEFNGSELASLLAMSGMDLLVHPSYPDVPASTWDAVPAMRPLLRLNALRARQRALGDAYGYVRCVPSGFGYRSAIVDTMGRVVAEARSDRPCRITAVVEPARERRSTPFFERRVEVFRTMAASVPIAVGVDHVAKLFDT